MMISLEGITPGSRVAVAMSGGVDSSVAAALVAEGGYDVVGITLQLYDHGQMLEKKGACCAGQDIYDAKMVADKIGFPHYVLDYESIFKQSVMDDFADSYLRGETPIPCIRCNQKVKFKDLLHTAKDLGAQALVTGHYVRRLETPQGAELHRALEHGRDQSYFLFTTTQEQLDYLRFPLGGMPKSETREHARRFGLKVSEKPDSQDICFVPGGNYAGVVAKLRPGALEPGDIVDLEGRKLGTHPGIIGFTIGQRKGLGISSNEPYYVVALDAEKRQVIVGRHRDLATSIIYIKEVNWLSPVSLYEKPYLCRVKIRSTHEPIPARVMRLKDSSWAQVGFEEPQYGVSGGQACVFFEGERVLGGGWITNSKP